MNWHKVGDILPDKLKLVLGYREILETYSVVFLSSQGVFMFAYEPEYASDITHWMPLPEPPEKEQGK